MKMWAIEFRSRNGSWWIDVSTLSYTRRDAWKRCLEMMGDDPDRTWWQQVHDRRDKGELRAVKVRVERVEA